MTGFGQTASSMSTPFQFAQPAQSSDAFSFSNFGQTQPAGASSFGGTPSMFGQNNFGLQVVPQNYVVAQATLITNPFGTLPALPQMSIGRVGTTPSVQYGISSIPTPARNSIRKEVGSSSGSDTADTSHSFVDKKNSDSGMPCSLSTVPVVVPTTNELSMTLGASKIPDVTTLSGQLQKQNDKSSILDGCHAHGKTGIVAAKTIYAVSQGGEKGYVGSKIFSTEGVVAVLWEQLRIGLKTENDSLQEEARQVANESPGNQQGAVGESNVQINCSDSDQGGLIELEKLLKQKTFTRSEIDHLTALMQSRAVDAPIGGGRRLKVFNEITSTKTTDKNTGIPSQCCEISNEDQNHIAPVSKPASGGEKQIDTSSSCNDQSHRIMQEDMKLDLKLEEENMDFLLSLLRSENENLTGLGAGIVIHSCQTRDEQNILSDAGSLEKLISGLDGSISQRDASLESIATILKKNPGAVAKFAELQNGRVLRSLLDDSGQVGEEVSFAFSSLVAGKEDMQKLAFEANAIDKFYNHLQNCDLHPKRLEVIFLALADLC
ncbi:hypothetical protein KIW84_042012 [Lathyrus oleraceus]|uniref:Uncharacterized protein n=1 Tax=Pisum sativum TaxID=3888 RepID=A0A9D4X9W6_PEA|nr:hypothetical protein KIW84_042012 [Pisum sativum]